VIENIIETETNSSPLEEIELQNPELQDLSYIPQSDVCVKLDTVVPAAMRYDMHKALETLDRRVNGVDEYVAEKLGYIKTNCTLDERKEGLKCLCDAFSAEQVDAIALAIYNIEEKGQGIIEGDQTGIGKGRVAAGLLRYAMQVGSKPIFITKSPNLFSDIYRDFVNIGSDDAVPLMFLEGFKEEVIESEADGDDLDNEDLDVSDIIKTPVYRANKNYDKEIKGKRRVVPFIINGRSTKTDIKDDNTGNILYRGLSDAETKNVFTSGIVPDEFDIILATYSQFSRAGIKVEFLKKISQGNILILDESHEASGESNVGRYMIECLEESKGVTWLSATFAKRPDNITLYATKTCMKDANMTSEDLIGAIRNGGVALQEIISTNLVAEGQMIRRERSFEGIEINYEYLDITQEINGYPDLNLEESHRATMDAATEIIRDIMSFQRDYIVPALDEMDEDVKAQYKEIEGTKGTSKAGIDNVPIFSGIYNIINQLLFSLKAEAVADIAIRRLKQGIKPVIAFASTMESFLDSLTNDDGTPVSIGDYVNPDFSKIFERRLNSILRYTEKDESGVKEYKVLDVNLLNQDTVYEYYKLLDKIKAKSIGISSSPIDVIVTKIQEAGYTCNEVTGRDIALKFVSDTKAQIVKRNKKTVNDAFREFNNNEVDCLLINQSGSTGASAHAVPTKKVKKEDVKQRCMIGVQVEPDVNKETQKRGRIGRTGQILPPMYDYAFSAIPAEKRLMMMNIKKLKSLDANTTSNQKQSKSFTNIGQVDFLNKYGDQIVFEYLKENPIVNEMIDDPLKIKGIKEDEVPVLIDAAHRVSGRIAVLSCKDQEKFYNEITQRYVSTIDYLIQSGQYDLEVEELNLEAETLSKEIVVVGKGGESFFGRNSILEKVKVSNLKKPFKKNNVESMIEESLSGYNPKELKVMTIQKYERFIEHEKEENKNEINEHYRHLINNIYKEKQYKKTKDNEKAEFLKDRKTTLENALVNALEIAEVVWERKRANVRGLLDFFYVGKVVAYPSIANDGTSSKAIFLGFNINEDAKNPYAPSSLKLRFAIASSQRYIAVPASKTDIINSIKAATYEKIFYSEQDSTLKNWDEIIKESSSDRVVRYIITGNILQAFGNADLKGSLISYTTLDGGVKKGILLPETFTPNATGEKAALKINVPIIKALSIIKSMQEDKTLTTKDEISIIRRSNDYKILVPASKAKGAKYYLDTVILKLTTEGLFNKVADRMSASIDEYKIENFVSYLQDKFGSSVEISKNQFNAIKDKEGMNEDSYDDEVKPSKRDIFIQKLTEVDTQESERRKQEEDAKKLETETNQKVEAEKNKQEIEQANILKRKLAMIAKLQTLTTILIESQIKMQEGGELRDERIEKIKADTYKIGVDSAKMNLPKSISENNLIKNYIEEENLTMPDVKEVAQSAFLNGYNNENEKQLLKILKR